MSSGRNAGENAAHSGAGSHEWTADWAVGEHGVPKERYISQAFANLEAEKLWPHVWQMACREEEVPRPGDYTVYEIIDQSILVIRTDEDTIKAYHNVCPHRATALAVGTGRFSTGEITCPFHGWRWNLEGDNTFVLDRDEFKGGCLSDDDVKLREVQVARWIGCVWINMDTEAPSFDDYIAPIRDVIEASGIGEMRYRWWKQIVSPGNWKMAQEAFHEGHHVMETHKELNVPMSEAVGGDKTLPSLMLVGKGLGNGHGILTGEPRHMELMGQPLTGKAEIENLILNQEVMHMGVDSLVLDEELGVARSLRRRDLPEGVPAREVYAQALREHYQSQGRAIAKPEGFAGFGVAFCFPNYTFLVNDGNALVYRSRPYGNDPDMVRYDFWSLTAYAPEETVPRPKMESIPVKELPHVLRQDFLNIPRIQRGMHSHGFEDTLFGTNLEQVISNMHARLDDYLSV